VIGWLGNLNGSWEQVQVNLLEKYICGSIKMGIVFYSMVLFRHDNHEGMLSSIAIISPL